MINHVFMPYTLSWRIRNSTEKPKGSTPALTANETWGLRSRLLELLHSLPASSFADDTVALQ